MKKIIAISLLAGMLSCKNETSEEIIDLVQVDIFTDSAMNMKTLRDLCAFNYQTVVDERTNIQGEDTIADFGWRTSVNAAGKATFQLVLGPKAQAYKNEISTVISDFIGKKLPEYQQSAPELDDVEKAAEHFMRLVEKADIDSAWLQSSPNLAKFASKDDFHQTLLQRKELFKPFGARSVENRRVSGELGTELKGEFYTIAYVYPNQKREEITIEKINGEYKLLGYHFMLNR